MRNMTVATFFEIRYKYFHAHDNQLIGIVLTSMRHTLNVVISLLFDTRIRMSIFKEIKKINTNTCSKHIVVYITQTVHVQRIT